MLFLVVLTLESAVTPSAQVVSKGAESNPVVA